MTALLCAFGQSAATQETLKIGLNLERSGNAASYGGHVLIAAQIAAAVKQAVIVGVPDRRLGEVGYAFIELEEGRSIASSNLEAFCRSDMADYKVPRYYKFVKQLPRTTTGKVLRAAPIQSALETVNVSDWTDGSGGGREV